MYSQYQSGNIHPAAGSAAAAGTTSSVPIGNGTEWVNTASGGVNGGWTALSQPNYPPNNPPSFSHYYSQQTTQQQQQQQQQQHQYSAPPPPPRPLVTSQELVVQYTNWYYQWTARYEQLLQQQQQQSGTLANNNTHIVSYEAALAKHNADNCSRAANYFHQRPGQTTAPPHELTLPPPPPAGGLSTNGVGSAFVQQQVGVFAQQQQPQPQQPQSRNDVPQASDDMKRYIDRCMQACTAPQDKQAVMALVQALIQRKIEAGTLHTTNWDGLPLLSNVVVPSKTEPTVASVPSGNARYYGLSSVSSTAPNVSAVVQPQGGTVYHGPGPVATGKKRKSPQQQINSSNRHSRASDDGNYYGPSTSIPVSQIDATADFISLPSLHKKIVNSKSKKIKAKNNTNTGAGFNQSDSILSSRANRFSGPGGVQDVSALTRSSVDDSEWHRYMGKSIIGGKETKLTEADYEQMTIKGTCQILEKDFLRLTAPPRAELVRPQHILEQHLENLKTEWFGNTNEQPQHRRDRRDYLWFCSQLKAMRQDCTVQRIQNAFAVDVYETHARIALEEQDMNEYNQCQTQLKELYALLERQQHGNDVPDADAQKGLRNQHEFLSYRLLYYVFLSVESQDYDGGSSDLFKIMFSLTSQQRNDPQIQHALAVRAACCSDILDYHAFFQLRRTCSLVGGAATHHLMDRLVPAVRTKALVIMWKGYRPSPIAADFVLQEMGMENQSESDLQFGRKYLESCGCVLSPDGRQMLTKETEGVHKSDLEDQKSLI